MNEIKEFEKIWDQLEHDANVKCSRTIKEAQAYCDGYKQACEDYFKRIKELIRSTEVESK